MHTSRPTRIRLAGETHVGQKRAINEDSFLLAEDEAAVVVADGMGGHAAGEVASRLAVETVVQHLRAVAREPRMGFPYRALDGSRQAEDRLETAVRLANSRIREEARVQQAAHGMGTTIVALQFFEGKAVIAHVGDSRCYRFRDGRLHQVTEDHSLLNDYIRMRGPQAAADFPQKNVIVRALGMKDAVPVDVQVDPCQAGDAYLVCSDGLHGMVSDDEIAEILGRETDPGTACARLVRAANEHGGTDNITAVLARWDG